MSNPDELSFDGFGINGTDPYGTRLATFNAAGWDRSTIDTYGDLFAASPDLLTALEEMRDDWLTAFDRDVNEGDPDAVRILGQADKAIAKAKGVCQSLKRSTLSRGGQS